MPIIFAILFIVLAMIFHNLLTPIDLFLMALGFTTSMLIGYFFRRSKER